MDFYIWLSRKTAFLRSFEKLMGAEDYLTDITILSGGGAVLSTALVAAENSSKNITALENTGSTGGN